MTTSTLATLLFGDYRQKVLALLLLHPEQSYHVREIARLTDTSAGTLHRELARLASAGVLTRSASGNQVRYAANRQCPIYPELAGILRKTAGVVDVLRQALAVLSPRIQVALVFGSLARATEGPRSDVDLLLIGDLGFAEVVQAVHGAQARLGREINPIVVSAGELRQRTGAADPFLARVLEGDKLYVMGNDDDLGKLAGHPTAASP